MSDLGGRKDYPAQLATELVWCGFPEPVPEYRFGAVAAGGGGRGLRKRLTQAGLKDWRFDLAYPDLKIAIEVEGAVYARGRHTRGKGYEDDIRKYNVATALGWRLYRFSTGMVESGEARAELEKYLSE